MLMRIPISLLSLGMTIPAIAGDGQVVGAVGVSGASSAQQDEEFSIAVSQAKGGGLQPVRGFSQASAGFSPARCLTCNAS